MGNITRKYIQDNLDTLFVYGDNDIRKGYGGLAKECRGEFNTAGIRVKKLPSLSENAFYTDEEYFENCRKIDEDINTILQLSSKYKIIWIPDGIGEGLAQLHSRAPKTLVYLKAKLNKLIFSTEIE